MDSESFGKAEAALAGVGIATREIKNGLVELKAPSAVLGELAAKFEAGEISAEKLAIILEDVGSKRQADILAAMVQNWNLYEKAMVDFSEGTGSAAREAQKDLESWEGKMNVLSNTWTKFIAGAVDTEGIKGFLDIGNGILSVFADITTTPVIGELTTLTVTVLSLGAAIKALSASNMGQGFLGFFKDIGQMPKNLMNYGNSLNMMKSAAGGAISGIENIALATEKLNMAHTKSFLVQNQLKLGTKALTEAQLVEVLMAKGLTEEKAAATAAEIMNTVAKKGNAGASVIQTGANLGLLGSIKAVTTGLLAQAAAWLASPMGMVTIAAAAVYGIVKAVDYFNVTLKEQKEILSDIRQKYSDLSSSLSEAEGQFDSANSRIKELQELQASGKITFVEKDELANLQAANIELEKQIELLRLQKEHAQEEERSAATKVFEKDLEKADWGLVYRNGQIAGANFWDGVNDVISTLTGNFGNAGWFSALFNVEGNELSGGLATENDYLAQQVQRYEELGNKMVEIRTRIAELEIKNQNKTATPEENRELRQLKKDAQEYEEIYKYLLEKQKEFSETIGDLKLIENPTTETEKAFNEFYKMAQDLDNIILKISSPDQYRKIKLDEIFSSDGFENTSNALARLKEEGELTPEAIKSYTEFNDAIEGVGLTAEEVATHLNSTQIATAELTAETLALTSAYEAWKDAQNGTESGDMYRDMQKALEQIEEGQKTGKTGTKAYEASVDLVFSDPEGNVKEQLDLVKRYLKDGEQGLTNFYNDLVKEGMAIDNGDFIEILPDVSLDDVAKKLGLGPELLQALSGALEEYDWDIPWSEQEFEILINEKGLDIVGKRIAETQAEIDKLTEKKEIGVDFTTSDQTALDKASAKLTQLQDQESSLKDAKVSIDASVEGDTKTQLQEISGELDGIGTKTDGLVAKKMGDFGAQSVTVPHLQSVFNKLITIDNFKFKPKTLTVTQVTTSSGKAPVPPLHGTGFADGTSGAPGGKTLVGELGRELVVSDGRYYTVGDSGAEFVNLKKGDIVFNHVDTEKILAGYTANRGQALAQGTAMAYGGAKIPGTSGSGSGSSGSGSSSSKSSSSSNSKSSAKKDTDAWLDAYKKAYDELRHLREMDKINDEQYYKKLTELDKKYFGTNQKYSSEHKKNLEELWDLQRKIYDKQISDIEHKIKMLSYEENSEKKQIAQYEKAQKQILVTLKKYRDMGLKEDHEYIQKLKEEYEDYAKKVIELNKKISDNKLADFEHDSDILSNFEGTEKQQIKLYEKAQKEILAQMKKYRDMGLSEDHEYLKDLEKQYWDYVNKIKAANKVIYEQKKSDYEMALSYINKTVDAQIKALEDEKKALQKKNDETDRAIELQKLQDNMANARQRTMRVYYEDTGWTWEEDRAAVEEAQKALDDFNNQEIIRKIDDQIDSWNDYKDSWGGLADEYELAQEKLIAEQILGKDIEADILNQRTTKINKFKNDYINILKEIAEAEKKEDLADKKITEKKLDPYDLKAIGDSLKNKLLGETNTPVKETPKEKAPTAPTTQTITIKSGDTLTALAKKYKTTVDNLLKLNPYITDKNKISAGKKLVVPKLAIGTNYVPASGLYNVDELGEELIVRKPDSGRFTYLEKGDGVVPGGLTKRLMEFASAKNPFANLLNNLTTRSVQSVNNVSNDKSEVHVHIHGNISLPSVKSGKDFVEEMKLLAQNR